MSKQALFKNPFTMVDVSTAIRKLDALQDSRDILRNVRKAI